MKNQYFILLCVMVVFASCKKFDLDTSSKSSFTEDIIFSNPSLAEGQLMSAYNVFGETNAYNDRLWPYIGYNTDIEFRTGATRTAPRSSTRASDLIGWYAANSDLADGYNNASGDPWSNVYTGIERTNLAEAGIRKYGDLTDPDMRHLLGEALALRSLFYSHLTVWWGDVPARFEPLNSDNLYIAKTDRDTIYNKILEDLKEAIDLMAPTGQGYSKINKRISKDAARALRARVAMTAAGYSMRPVGEVESEIKITASPERQRQLYEIARSETKAIIASSAYKLDPSFKNVFFEQMKNFESQGREVMLTLPNNYKVRGRFMGNFGLPRVEDGTATTAKHTVYGTSANFTIMPTFFYDFDLKDLRRDITIVPYSVVKASDGKMEQSISSIVSMRLAKFRPEWYDGPVPSSHDGVSPILIRYADVLLMYAEADLFLGETDGGKYFNMVRRRGFGVDINSPSVYDLPLTLQNIQQERAFEFCGENIRKFDLMRWGILKAKIEEAKQNLKNLRDGTGKYTDVPKSIYFRKVIIDPSDGERGLVVYGLNRGEFQNKITAEPNAGWSVRAWTNYYSGTEQAYDLSDLWIQYLTHGDPDKRQLLPIMSQIIVTSNGKLYNDYGYNN